MSYEYVSAARLTTDEVLVLRGALARRGFMVLDPPEVVRIRLRFSDAASTGTWPEDAEIVAGDSVFVVVHGGTRAIRERLIATLEDELTRMGHTCTFSEA
jgi:hypothetical protein